MRQLWPFQQAALRELSQGFRQHRRQCLVLPTGSGKTAVSGAVSLRVYKEVKKKTLYLVHRRELVHQVVSTLEELGLGDQVGVIQSGRASKPWQPIQVASVQTLVRRPQNRDWLNAVLVIVDEAHHVRASTWETLLDWFKGAYWLGLTATPVRLDGKGLKTHFDKLVIGPQISDLVPEYLCPIKTYSIPPQIDMGALRQKDAVGGPVIADALSNWMRLAGGKRTLFFAHNVSHSRDLVEKVRAVGVSAAHLDFRSSATERDKILSAFHSGSLQFLSNVEIFTEGMDAPDCECVVLGRKTSSFTLYRQMNGRVMRKKAHGGDGLILDLAGNVDEHGVPDADVEWSLDYGVIEPETVKQKQVRICKSCGYTYPPSRPECPLCGAEHPVEQVREESIALEEATRRGNRKRRAVKRDINRRVIATGGDRKELERLRVEMKFKPGWTYKMIEIFSPVWRQMRR